MFMASPERLILIYRFSCFVHDEFFHVNRRYIFITFRIFLRVFMILKDAKEEERSMANRFQCMLFSIELQLHEEGGGGFKNTNCNARGFGPSFDCSPPGEGQEQFSEHP